MRNGSILAAAVIALLAVVPGAHAQSFETEPNNTQADANTLVLGVATRAQTSTATDHDWFKIVVTSAGTLTVTLAKVSNNDYVPTVQLRDSQDALIAAGNGLQGGGFGAASEAFAVGVVAGTYYLHFTPYVPSAGIVSEGIGSYTLTATLAASAAQFETEPNQTAPQATAHTAGKQLRGQVSTAADEDWYKLTVTEAGAISIKVSKVDFLDSLPGSQLRDAQGNVVASSVAREAGGFGETETSYQAGVSPGAYYLRLTPYTSSSTRYRTGNYSIDITYPGPAPAAGGDITVVSPIFTGSTLSYLRLINGVQGAETTTISVIGSPSGRTYGTARMTVPEKASIQYSIFDILNAAGAGALSNGDDAYVLYLQSPAASGLKNGFQHVLYNQNNGFFENASACTFAVGGDYTLGNRTLVNLHTSILGAYPSEVHVHNPGASAATYGVLATDGRTGARIGTVTITVPAKSSRVFSMSYFQAALNWTPSSAQQHANLYFSPAAGAEFKAALTSFVYNQALSTYVNMTQACVIN